MRALLILALLTAALPGRADVARGIDHARHQSAALSAGKEIACTDCHGVAASGVVREKPTHRWCFESCHPAPAKKSGKRPYPVTTAERPVCEVCHSGASLSAAERDGSAVLASAAAFPPADDFASALSHERHSGSTCATCHAFARTEPLPHSRCVSCHRREPAASAAAMTACASCHQTRQARAESSPFVVGASYSHRQHAPRGGRDCARCHPDAATATEMVMTRPAKATCKTCHDGGAAFTVEQKCRQCHQPPETLGEKVRAVPIPLRHASHTAIECASCHEGGGAFRARAGHALCATGECHPGELESRTPTICSSCHVGSEPWLPQHIDTPRRRASDFGVKFEHRPHLSKGLVAIEACTSCHSGDPSGRSDGVAGAHRACSGASCHDAGGAPPLLSDCAGCHQLGARDQRRVAARARPWSVSARFAHRGHRTDAAGAELACNSCHALDISPPPGLDLAPPPKATCVGCHDGGKAFKVTGHQCKRCHER